MADTPRESDIPEAVAEPKRRWSLSLVWLIPLVAVVIGGWLAVKTILEQGPTITITFKTAEGLEAGKTKIKYKNVDVGEVKSIALSPDVSAVIVTAQLGPKAVPYLVADTRFWVVRARVGAGGVTGLGTLFSGAYIGVDIGKSKTSRRDFTGLETPPIVTGDEPGRQFVLRSQDLGSLDISSPVYFRRVQVGEVVAHQLDKSGKAVTIRVFVHAPFDQYVNPNTRFWNASGFDFTFDATGVKVETQSLLSVLAGGLAFETPAESLLVSPADENMEFTLFPDRASAMKRPDIDVAPVVVHFEESLRGLSVGAPVDLSGITVGEVKSIGVELDEEIRAVRFPVEIALYPERLRSRSRHALEMPVQTERRARMDALVAQGLRAQLRTGNLVTGQLYVAFDFFPNAPKANIDWTKKPPEMPAVPGGLVELQLMVTNIAKKIANLPLDELSTEVRSTLRTLSRTLESTNQLVKRIDAEVAPKAADALHESRRALQAAGRVLAVDAPLQQDMRDTLRELTRAAQSLGVLADYLERHPEAIIRGKKVDQR
jgi:paraquat-inducible protein B